jgi:hypothetical protein
MAEETIAMNTAAGVFRPSGASAWTRERLDKLSRQELLNLQVNAARLGEHELAELCAQLLKERPRAATQSDGAARRTKGRSRFLPRSRAFAARGVWLQDPRMSWSGVRKADGAVVMAIWQSAVQLRDGVCACLLWAPNLDGLRPWSDTSAGQERLEHCRLAVERQGAEGLLVHGEALEGRLPEDRARTVLGIDPETVIQLRVEQRGAEYWAVWGKKAADR